MRLSIFLISARTWIVITTVQTPYIDGYVLIDISITVHSSGTDLPSNGPLV